MPLTTNIYILYYGIPIIVFSILSTITYKNNSKALEHRLLAGVFAIYGIIFMFEWYRHFRPVEDSAFMTTWFNGLLMAIALSMTTHVCVILYEKHTNLKLPFPNYLLYVIVVIHIIVGVSPYVAQVEDFTRDGIWIRRDAPAYELWISIMVISSTIINTIICILAYKRLGRKTKSKKLFLYLMIVIPINAILYSFLVPLIPYKYEPSIPALYVMLILALLILLGIDRFNLFPQYTKRYITMFEKNPLCMFILDENYIITEINEETAKYFRTTSFIGANYLDILRATDNYELVYPYLKQLRRHREFVDLSLQMKHYATKEMVHLSVYANEIEENGQLFYYIMFRDRTLEVIQDKKIRELAFFDKLTKLPNRASFLEECGKLFTTEKEGILLLIDLNNFKAINDQYGHAAGDEVLIATGEVLFEIAQQQHFPARIGGDEFVLYVLPNRLEGTIEALIKQLNQLLTSKKVTYNDQVLHFNASIGYAYKQPHMTFDELINVADQSMYEQKQKTKHNK